MNLPARVRANRRKARFFLLCSLCGLPLESILGWFPLKVGRFRFRVAILISMTQSQIAFRDMASRLIAKLRHHSRDSETPLASFPLCKKQTTLKPEHKSQSAALARDSLEQDRCHDLLSENSFRVFIHMELHNHLSQGTLKIVCEQKQMCAYENILIILIVLDLILPTDSFVCF